MTSLPRPEGSTGLQALRALIKRRSPLAALEVFQRELGEIFLITLPVFRPVMLSGPDACRFVLVEAKEDLLWRPENDPVTCLLRRGILVQDGVAHDKVRQAMMPPLHRQQVADYTEIMWQSTDRVMQHWQSGETHNMLHEMRKVALLILMDALYGVDFEPELHRLWKPIHQLLRYISPGLWIVWPGVPRPGFNQSIQMIDDYFYRLIADKRQNPDSTLVGVLLKAGLSDGLIRDQLLTMFIAGHDTSTALLAWTLYLLGKYPDAMQQAQQEVRQVTDGSPPAADDKFPYLENVIKESLRLYPPIHLGNRIAARDLTYKDYMIPAETRVVYSIYLTQRDPAHWSEPDQFRPERFETTPAPYTYLPFGGGKRNCIGAVFAQLEARIVLARILQRFDLQLLPRRVKPYMGATLEPRPGVFMQTTPL